MSCAHRRKGKHRQLSTRLFVRCTLPFILTAIVLSVAVYGFTYHSLLTNFETELRESAEILTEHYIDEYRDLQCAYDDPELLQCLYPASDMAVLILTDSGATGRCGSFDILDADIVDPGAGAVIHTRSDGLTLMVLSAELTAMGLPVRMVFALKVDWILQYLAQLCRILVLINAAGIVTALIVGLFTVKGMLQPIQSMILEIRAIDEDALSTRLEVPEADDELRTLALTANGLLDRVETAFERQKQFTQNASHELRTPLSVMQGNTDILLRWGSSDPATVQRCASAIHRQLDYMNRLVGNLLFLSRGDSRSQQLTIAECPVSMISEILDDRREIDPKHRYVFHAEDISTLRGDAALLRQLLFILLDNAARYTPDDGCIRVALSRADGTVRLSVIDEGCGVPEDQLEKIFERFYRIDKARSRATGGTGLGLSIARTIAELHGGTIHAEPNAPRGLRVITELPDRTVTAR